MKPQERAALKDLGLALRARSYHFICPTPATHDVVLSRSRDSDSETLRELFGWSRAVPMAALEPEILELLEKAKMGNEDQGFVRSQVRFSSLDGKLFVHSSFPTDQTDSVFFGPDSYRFVRFLKERIKKADRIWDVGCGSGVGGLCLQAHLSRLASRTPELFLTDINPRSLDFSKVNAAINSASDVEIFESDLFEKAPTGADTIIANPPFMADGAGRSYRHGGGPLGSDLSLRIVQGALRILPPGGQLALYTGACIVGGQDVLWREIKPLIQDACSEVSYEELDVDIFGEELREPAYAKVERIAAVGLFLRR